MGVVMLACNHFIRLRHEAFTPWGLWRQTYRCDREKSTHPHPFEILKPSICWGSASCIFKAWAVCKKSAFLTLFNDRQPGGCFGQRAPLPARLQATNHARAETLRMVHDSQLPPLSMDGRQAWQIWRQPRLWIHEGETMMAQARQRTPDGATGQQPASQKKVTKGRD